MNSSPRERFVAAVFANQPDVVRAILEDPAHRSLVNERLPDTEGRGHWDDPTPLIHAAERGHTELVRVLLAHGADPSLRTNSYYDDWGNERGGGATARDLARAHPELLALLPP